MAVERYLSRCIPDLRGGNDIGKNRSVPNPFIYVREGVHIFRGYMVPLKILQLHILEVQSRPRFQTAKNNYANPPLTDLSNATLYQNSLEND